MSDAAAATLRVALGEYDTGWHRPEASLALADSVVRDAAGCGARLVVLPEMATSGFTMDTAHAVTMDSPQVRSLQEIAQRHDVWLVAGVALAEAARGGAAGECAVNAALVIDPEGRIVAVHRKQRLFAFAGEHEVYTAGESPTTVTIEGVRIGLFICYELRFAEVFAAVAAQCDCMVLIANWPAALRSHWDALVRARAIENQCAFVAVNRTGTGGGITYDGGSVAYDAWGDELPSDEGCGVPVVTVDPAAVAEVRRAYPFLLDR
jgi:omega-amidase